MDEINNNFSEISAEFIGTNKIKKMFFEKLNEDQIEDILGVNPFKILSINSNDSKNVKLVFKILGKYLKNKIEALEELNPYIRRRFKENGLNQYNSIINDEIYNELLQEVNNLGKGYNLALREYLNNESKLIHLLFSNIDKDSAYIIKNYEMDYSNFIFKCLNDIISLYNDFSNIINEVLNFNALNLLDNKYIQIYERIEYTSNELEESLNVLLNNIIKSSNCSRIYVFEDNILNKDFSNNFSSKYNNIMFVQFLYSVFGNDNIIKYLTNILESITLDAEIEFYHHTQKTIIIFINPNFKEDEEVELRRLQNRSNVAIYNLYSV
ncbi:hypothetical protein [Metabacillus fastidiosus]|uniref:hypothetical protein n=1 Tax=Metabacillus fastidiosus TaxID=1458 RepID=UPI003D28E907